MEHKDVFWGGSERVVSPRNSLSWKTHTLNCGLEGTGCIALGRFCISQCWIDSKCKEPVISDKGAFWAVLGGGRGKGSPRRNVPIPSYRAMAEGLMKRRGMVQHMTLRRACVDVVDTWPACLPPLQTGFTPRPAHSRIFAIGSRAGRCRWSAGFSGDLPFPPSLHSGAAPYSSKLPSLAAKTWLLRAAQISSLTQPLYVVGPTKTSILQIHTRINKLKEQHPTQTTLHRHHHNTDTNIKNTTDTSRKRQQTRSAPLSPEKMTGGGFKGLTATGRQQLGRRMPVLRAGSAVRMVAAARARTHTRHSGLPSHGFASARAPVCERERERVWRAPAADSHAYLGRHRDVNCYVPKGPDWKNKGFCSDLFARLACSPPTNAIRAQSPAMSPDFRMWESYRRRVFSGISRFHRNFIPAPLHTSITLIGSQDHAVSTNKKYPMSYTLKIKRGQICTSPTTYIKVFCVSEVLRQGCPKGNIGTSTKLLAALMLKTPYSREFFQMFEPVLPVYRWLPCPPCCMSLTLTFDLDSVTLDLKNPTLLARRRFAKRAFPFYYSFSNKIKVELRA
ncbi:hypothetical protein PR048_006147 [Dryococelus australis]|uniref:Uncharacterized protein n=1 Tax=Dryococelus australis TaxID=614101 RepID=A0ABQ9IA62_9NEOP|nr:hypothetical protein PR048_006147 [Dryococelus australis]